jgi:exodeoxyribonuclease III
LKLLFDHNLQIIPPLLKYFSNKNAKYTSINPETNLGEIISEYNPDILCFQETRCDSKTAESLFKFPEYHQFWNSSKGLDARSGNRYSGTCLWSKDKPEKIIYDIPDLNDTEGRIIIAEYSEFIIINTYVPNSGSNFEYRINIWNTSIKKYHSQSNILCCLPSSINALNESRLRSKRLSLKSR